MSRRGTLRAGIALVAVMGCGTDDMIDGLFTEAEWAKIELLSPLPPVAPENPSNRYADDPFVAELGQMLFFEPGFAGPIEESAADNGSNGGLGQVGETGKVSCASCHDPEGYFSDTRSKPGRKSLGVRETTMHTPPLVNAGFYEHGGWEPKHSKQWQQAANGFESGVNFGGNRLQVAHYLYEKYREEYDARFPEPLDPRLDPTHPDAADFPPEGRPKRDADAPDGPWEAMDPADQQIINTIMANIGKAIEAYERRLVSGDAPFDRYVAGDLGAMSASAKRGLKLFIGKAGCDACHNTPQFSNDGFHNTGVNQDDDETMSQGLYDGIPGMLNNLFSIAGPFSDDPAWGMAQLAKFEQTEATIGQFRTKGLRSVAETGPYMHNGSIATLEDVIAFYNRAGDDAGFLGVKDPLMVPLNLTAAESADLVEFLRALTGEPVEASLRQNTAKP